MMTHNDHFFATEISYDHSRPYTTGKIKQQSSQTPNPYLKMKMIKSQLKQANQQYTQALKSNQKTRNSVDKANKNTQLTRVNFLKVYQTKRMKMYEKQLMEDLKERLRQCSNQSAERAHRIRNQGQIQSRLLKHEQQQYLQQLRMKNKREKEQIRLEKERNKKLLYDSAKKQYQQIKNAQTQLLVRRRKIESMLQARAKQNYITKLSKQMQLLNSYNMLAKQLNDIESQQPEQQVRATSKSFFITKQ